MATETELRELAALASREDSEILIMHFLDQRAAGNPELGRAYVRGALQLMEQGQSMLSTLTLICVPLMLLIVGIPLYFWIQKVRKEGRRVTDRLNAVFDQWKDRAAAAA